MPSSRSMSRAENGSLIQFSQLSVLLRVLANHSARLSAPAGRLR